MDGHYYSRPGLDAATATSNDTPSASQPWYSRPWGYIKAHLRPWRCRYSMQAYYDAHISCLCMVFGGLRCVGMAGLPLPPQPQVTNSTSCSRADIGSWRDYASCSSTRRRSSVVHTTIYLGNLLLSAN